MAENQDKLLEAFQKIMTIKGECNSKVCDFHRVEELTVTQLKYLKIIDSTVNMTFSLLSEKLKISKPSVSDLINKLVALDCVYKEPCTEDKRVTYIRLTEKGTNIARYEQTTVENLINRIMKSLEKNEVETLIEILNKVE